MGGYLLHIISGIEHIRQITLLDQCVEIALLLVLIHKPDLGHHVLILFLLGVSRHLQLCLGDLYFILRLMNLGLQLRKIFRYRRHLLIQLAQSLLQILLILLQTADLFLLVPQLVLQVHLFLICLIDLLLGLACGNHKDTGAVITDAGVAKCSGQEHDTCKQCDSLTVFCCPFESLLHETPKILLPFPADV